MVLGNDNLMHLSCPMNVAVMKIMQTHRARELYSKETDPTRSMLTKMLILGRLSLVFHGSEEAVG